MVDILAIETYEAAISRAEFAGIEFPHVARLHYGQASYMVGVIRKQSVRLASICERRLQESIAQFTKAEFAAYNERIEHGA